MCAMGEGAGERGQRGKADAGPWGASGTHILLPCNRRPERQQHGPGASPAGEKVASAITANPGSLRGLCPLREYVTTHADVSGGHTWGWGVLLESSVLRRPLSAQDGLL